ncbi:MAG TPA: class I SAM-dependent methyltransferase [Spirochaetota bacterium]|nr:class I SAM-dependent methyltransferase [Spirochaetota bacterium]
MKFDDRQFAHLYQRQQEETGYPGRLLPFIMNQLKGCSSVIDIGAGSGFFSIPAAASGFSVTAVEPSEEMAGIMQKLYSDTGSGSLTISLSRWEDWYGPVHDASICVHSFYPLTDKRFSVKKMLMYSEHRIIIIRNSPKMRSITGAIRAELGMSGIPDHNELLVSILNELNIEFSITEITEQRDTVITSLEDEAESIIVRTDFNRELKSEVIEIIRKNTAYSAGKYIFHSVFCDNAYVF